MGLLNDNHMLPALHTLLLLHNTVSGDYPLVDGNLISTLQLGLFCLVFRWSRLGDVMKAQPIRKWPQALTGALYYYQITPRRMTVSGNNPSLPFLSFCILSMCVWRLELDPSDETDMAAHQEPDVTSHICWSSMTVVHTLDQPVMKRKWLELF